MTFCLSTVILTVTGRYAIMALAVLILGISKTGFGGGIGILSIPLFALTMPAAQMLAVLAVLLVVVDLFANLHFLGEYDKLSLRALLPGAVFGVIVGCAILLAMQARSASPAAFNRTLSLTIGAICMLIVIVQVIRLTGVKLHSIGHGPIAGVIVGVVAGTVSTISQSAGPIVTLFLLDRRIEKRRLVGTMLLYTLLINSVKLVAYIAIGTVTLATSRQSLWMIPILPVGTIAGAWMNRRISEKPFAAIVYVATAVAAIKMIYDATVT